MAKLVKMIQIRLGLLEMTIWSKVKVSTNEKN